MLEEAEALYHISSHKNYIFYHQAIGVMEVLMALKSSDVIGLGNISPVRRSQTSCSDGARNW